MAGTLDPSMRARVFQWQLDLGEVVELIRLHRRSTCAAFEDNRLSELTSQVFYPRPPSETTSFPTWAEIESVTRWSLEYAVIVWGRIHGIGNGVNGAIASNKAARSLLDQVQSDVVGTGLITEDDLSSLLKRLIWVRDKALAHPDGDALNAKYYQGTLGIAQPATHLREVPVELWLEVAQSYKHFVERIDR